VSAGLKISAVLLSTALTVIAMTEVIGHSAERARIRRLRRRVRQERSRTSSQPASSASHALPTVVRTGLADPSTFAPSPLTPESTGARHDVRGAERHGRTLERRPSAATVPHLP
jgi:hypothetical protein